MAINETKICLEATTNENRSLLCMENLTLPSVGLLIQISIYLSLICIWLFICGAPIIVNTKIQISFLQPVNSKIKVFQKLYKQTDNCCNSSNELCVIYIANN